MHNGARRVGPCPTRQGPVRQGPTLHGVDFRSCANFIERTYRTRLGACGAHFFTLGESVR